MGSVDSSSIHQFRGLEINRAQSRMESGNQKGEALLWPNSIPNLYARRKPI
jgi:hypothetical protein